MTQDPSMMSAPVNLENPGFDSLLSALKAVHTGEMGMDVLHRYHPALKSQLEASRQHILSIPEPAGFEGLDRDQRNTALGSLAVVGALLDQLARYIDAPTQENVGACVDLVLQSQRMTNDVRKWLDKFIVDAESQPSPTEPRP